MKLLQQSIRVGGKERKIKLCFSLLFQFQLNRLSGSLGLQTCEWHMLGNTLLCTLDFSLLLKGGEDDIGM